MIINGVEFAPGISYRIAWVQSRLKRKEKLLNIGVGDQLYGFEHVSDVVLFDMDKYRYKDFVQGDAHHLPFKAGSFDTVLISDVLEHVVDPVKVCKEATRVCRRLILTIFEEWRLGSEGQHIEYGHEIVGQLPVPDDVMESVSEDTQSHRPHIWQYTDKMIKDIIWSTGWDVTEFSKEPECIHQGHLWWNWFVILEKPIFGGVQQEYPSDPINHFPKKILEDLFASMPK